MMKSKFVFIYLLFIYRIIQLVFLFHREWIYNCLIFSLILCLLIKRDSKIDGYIIFGLSMIIPNTFFGTTHWFPYYYKHVGMDLFRTFLMLYVFINRNEIYVDSEDFRVEFENFFSQT